MSFSCKHTFAVDGQVHEPYTSNFHAHPIWQLELIRKGPITARIHFARQPLTHGDILVIPPGIKHRFHYPKAGAAWLSFRFEVNEAPAVWAVRHRPSDAMSESLVSALWVAVKQEPGTGKSTDPKVVDHLLSALLLHVFRTPESVTARATLRERLQSWLLERGGTALRVEEAAAACNLSVSRFHALFRAEQGVSPKAFIDAERARLAGQLLAGSDLSVTRVAKRMGFPDVYSFSRFFRRETGVTAKAFRTKR